MWCGPDEETDDKLSTVYIPHTQEGQAAATSEGAATFTSSSPPYLPANTWGMGAGMGSGCIEGAVRQQSPVTASGACAAGMDIVHDGGQPPAETHDRLLLAAAVGAPETAATAMQTEPQSHTIPCVTGGDTPETSATVTTPTRVGQSAPTPPASNKQRRRQKRAEAIKANALAGGLGGGVSQSESSDDEEGQSKDAYLCTIALLRHQQTPGENPGPSPRRGTAFCAQSC